ncbi:hypothetical protein P3875_09680 [Myroides sp. JBRI-B21084]|uniref:hypothetical protein n=1 Tax=Myroides sp. JBRI-B21084 TaxID=3119977 RepID=UPI0026E14546|nr:hypothetical protein [Paenimyroides cloacae]WKW46046.1 hypothetical protein P3875_09680 [Paenimyroides cloacae]
MKYLIISVLFLTLFTSCNKKNTTVPIVTTKISQDSLVRSIHKKWQFKVVVANNAVASKINNWDQWNNFSNELTIKPNASLSSLKRKATILVEKAAVLKTNIPEMYNKPEVKARLALLETNIQNLDMLLELEPLNIKEINNLLAAIQKNTNSLINQFNEFEIKANIPKETGEDQLMLTIDTVKRATLNALPTE